MFLNDKSKGLNEAVFHQTMIARKKTLYFNLSNVAKLNVGPLLPLKSDRLTSTYVPRVLEDKLSHSLGMSQCAQGGSDLQDF